MILVSETAQNMKFFVKDFLSKYKKIQQTFHTDNKSNISGFIHWIGDDGKMCVCFLEMLETFMLILLAFSFSTKQRSNLWTQVYVVQLVLFKRDIFLYQYVNTKTVPVFFPSLPFLWTKTEGGFHLRERKLSEIFIFTLCCGAWKGFMGALRANTKPFEASESNVKIKI